MGQKVIIFLGFFLLLVIVIPFSAFLFLPKDSGPYLDFNTKILGLPAVLAGVVLIAYCLFIFFLTIYLTPKFFSFPPSKNTVMSEEGLRQQIKDYFSDSEEKRKIFEVTEKDDLLLVTWSKEITFSQIINMGSQSKKSIYILRFDDQDHAIKVLNKIVDFDWAAGVTGLGLSWNFQQGVDFSFETTYQPSLDIVDGKYVLNLKNLKYNSNELLGPIHKMASDSGWTLQFVVMLSRWIPNLSLGLSVLTLLIGFGWYYLRNYFK